MLAYLIRTATVTNPSGIAGLIGSPNDTYANSIYFNSFTLAGSGLILGMILRPVTRLYVASLMGSKSYQGRLGSASNNWGSSLTADETDFSSTDEYQEATVTPLSTGWAEIELDKNHLDLNGNNWFSLFPLAFNEIGISNMTVNSSNNTSNKPHLRIYLKKGADIGIRSGLRRLGKQWVYSKGSGGGGFLDYFGITADGSITRTETQPGQIYPLLKGLGRRWIP